MRENNRTSKKQMAKTHFKHTFATPVRRRLGLVRGRPREDATVRRRLGPVRGGPRQAALLPRRSLLPPNL